MHDAEHDDELLAAIDAGEQLRLARLDPEFPVKHNLKEHPNYPGYYYDDPRYPPIQPEDRYLMDHPGPDWRTKPKRDDPRPRTLPEQAAEHRRYVRQNIELVPTPTPTPEVEIPFVQPDTPMKQYGFWLCRVCRKAMAIYPSEIAWRWKLLGLQGTVVFRAPLACPNCRIMRQSAVKALGRQDHRRTWMAIIALVTGEQYPTMSKRLARILRFRNWLVKR